VNDQAIYKLTLAGIFTFANVNAIEFVAGKYGPAVVDGKLILATCFGAAAGGMIGSLSNLLKGRFNTAGVTFGSIGMLVGALGACCAMTKQNHEVGIDSVHMNSKPNGIHEVIDTPPLPLNTNPYTTFSP